MTTERITVATLGNSDEDSKGIPAGGRGEGSGNAGKSVKDWRAGRGAT